jgi:hypothetical protein
MLSIAALLSRNAVRRSITGALAGDPVVPADARPGPAGERRRAGLALVEQDAGAAGTPSYEDRAA